jgi:hypothetical protein
LSVLIERVQEGLSQPTKIITPNKSLKSLQVSNSESSSDNNYETPTARTHRPRLNSTTMNDLQHWRKAEEDLVVETAPNNADSSDYGDEFDDDDLDASLLAAFESNLQEAIQGEAQEPASTLPPDRNTKSTPFGLDKATLMSSVKVSGCSGSSIMKADDEFGDSDDDLLEADLEHIVSQFDKKSSVRKDRSSPVKASKLRQKENTIAAESDGDEFDDDGLDELDFEAAEVTATQSLQQSANSFIPVRTRFP